MQASPVQSACTRAAIYRTRDAVGRAAVPPPPSLWLLSRDAILHHRRARVHGSSRRDPVGGSCCRWGKVAGDMGKVQLGGASSGSFVAVGCGARGFDRGRAGGMGNPSGVARGGMESRRHGDWIGGERAGIGSGAEVGRRHGESVPGIPELDDEIEARRGARWRDQGTAWSSMARSAWRTMARRGVENDGVDPCNQTASCKCLHRVNRQPNSLDQIFAAPIRVNQTLGCRSYLHPLSLYPGPSISGAMQPKLVRATKHALHVSAALLWCCRYCKGLHCHETLKIFQNVQLSSWRPCFSLLCYCTGAWEDHSRFLVPIVLFCSVFLFPINVPDQLPT